MNKIKISIPVLALFCIYIYPVMIKGPIALSYLYIYGIPIIYVLLNHKLYCWVSKRAIFIILFSFILLALSILCPLLHATYDYSYIIVSTYVFRKAVIYLFLIGILKRYYRKDITASHFMYYFSLVQATYVLGTMVLVFVPGVKAAWFRVFREVVESEEYLESYGYTFRIGWQGFSGYGYTMFCSFSCLFLIYLYYGRNREIDLQPLQFAVPFFLSFMGNMFYGRSGLVVSIVGCSIALFVWNRSHFKRIAKIVLFVILGLLMLYLLRNLPLIRNWYGWMSRPIISLFTTGRFNSYSLNATHDMVFMPDVKTILLGDGYYTYRGAYYMFTDSGIMRSILFWGIIGAALSYGLTLYSLIELKRRDTLLFLLFVGAFLAYEYKGHVYFDFIALMLAMSYVSDLQRRDRRGKKIENPL